MMAAQFEHSFIQDLQKPLKIHYCPDIVFSKDNLSNVITITLYDGDTAYSGGGTVSATCIRPDGTTVPIDNGTITGNAITVSMTNACVDVPGQIQLFAKLSSGEVVTTVFAGVFTAVLTETDSAIDPGTIIPSINDLITSIENAIDSIPTDLTDLMGAVAPTYSNASTYAVGDYAWYSGELKRCIVPITTPESWTAAHWTAAAVGNDLAVKIAETESGIVINL